MAGSSTVIQSDVLTYQTQYGVVVYNLAQLNAVEVQLAPIVGVYPSTTYQTGTILAQYQTGVNQGKFFNYSAAATGVQAKALAILVCDNLWNVSGSATVDDTYATYSIVFITSGMFISRTALAAANAAADVTAFLASLTKYQIPPIGSIPAFNYEGQADNVIIVQSA